MGAGGRAVGRGIWIALAVSLGDGYASLGASVKLQFVPCALFAMASPRVQGTEAGAQADAAIFEVKDSKGGQVFGVYESGVRFAACAAAMRSSLRGEAEGDVVSLWIWCGAAAGFSFCDRENLRKAIMSVMGEGKIVTASDEAAKVLKPMMLSRMKDLREGIGSERSILTSATGC